MIKKIDAMMGRGATISRAADTLNVNRKTAEGWMTNYKKYLAGQPYTSIHRAVVYMKIQQAKIDFKSKEVQPKAVVKEQKKPKKITILWGFMTISW